MASKKERRKKKDMKKKRKHYKIHLFYGIHINEVVVSYFLVSGRIFELVHCPGV